MNEIIIGIIVGIIIIVFLWPYFSLCYLSGIENELREIKKEMEKINEGLRGRN